MSTFESLYWMLLLTQGSFAVFLTGLGIRNLIQLYRNSDE